MSALHIKLLRDLVRLWPQALAIAFVLAAGAATLILGIGAYQSLSETRAAYYDRNRFADVFADLTRAPKIVEDEIARIPGVASVETRIAKIALLDLPTVPEPASAMFVSIPEFQDQKLNLLYMRSGRLPLPADENEVVVSEPFAKANKFDIGSTFDAILNGRKRTLRVVGTALSPEFIYSLGPYGLIPDDKRYGIVWMREKALAAAYDLTGAFSSVHLKLTSAAAAPEAIQQLDGILARYGGLGAHGRRDQTSHAFLDAELQQLKAMSRILPPVFLLVAAFLVNMTLSRLILLEREQIGLLKALGYGGAAVGWHYLQFALAIAVVGIAIGIGAGTWLGFGMTRLYADFYHFPFLVFRTDPAIYVIAAGVTLAAAAVGALRAVRDVVALPPAVAMSPPAPAVYRRLLPQAFYAIVNIPQSLIMVTRHLLRWPIRTVSSVLGIALAVSVLVGSMWAFGSTEFMIDVTYNRAERANATINFGHERTMSAYFDTFALPGVLTAEPYRSVPVRIYHGPVERRIAISGKPPQGDLSRVLGPGLMPVQLPESGIALSDALARILKAKVGDLVEVELLERDRRRAVLPVTGVIEGYLGLNAYMSLPALNRLMREGATISGVNLLYDTARQDELFRRLKTTPVANFIALQRTTLQNFRQTLQENLLVMITVYVSLGVIIAFGVVYNFARISLSEQGRELASLRVLGFHKSEVSAILLSELAVLTIVAQPLGWVIGYFFAWAMVQGFNSELYRVPLVVERSVYAWASVIVFASALASALVVRQRIDRLDLIEVLKTRE
ncbi:ABC transporter permease [Pseudolabrys sp. FHR47]|uniref:ABC transporter permease n=1 Tax=Pseudolabrys sp. FHR47 TaxID=2562284 RepID=UPI0010BF2DF8|nr:ABC transporter permease [Pseudolabrys sp. FHR47]